MCNRTKRGFTLLEMMVVLAVTVTGTVMGVRYMNDYFDDLRNRAAADYLKTVATAASDYISQNYATLSVEGNKTISLESQDLNLPSTFNRKSGPLGKTYALYLWNPSVGKVEALVAATGNGDGDAGAAMRIAQIAGNQGGYATDAVTIIGTGGAWKVDRQSVSGLPVIKPGDFFYSLNTQNTGLPKEFLYRTKVNGLPELNKMQTDLDMGKYSLDNTAWLGFYEVKMVGDECPLPETKVSNKTAVALGKQGTLGDNLFVYCGKDPTDNKAKWMPFSAQMSIYESTSVALVYEFEDGTVTMRNSPIEETNAYAWITVYGFCSGSSSDIAISASFTCDARAKGEAEEPIAQLEYFPRVPINFSGAKSDKMSSAVALTCRRRTLDNMQPVITPICVRNHLQQ